MPNNIIGLGVSLFIGSIIVLFMKEKEKSMLHVLLLLALVSFLADVLLNIIGTARYTVGWYASRIVSLFSSSVVLGAFIFELNKLYVRLGKAHEQLRETNEALEQQLTYQFIYAMQGEIAVDSKVGVGTTVSILLPLKESDAVGV